MNSDFGRSALSLMLLGCFAVLPAKAQQISSASSAPATAFRAAGSSSLPASDLISPQELARSLRSASGAPLLILQVGFRVLYAQAHIPGSEYVGPANTPEGIQQLRKRVSSLARTQSVILYCGCCPWKVCPNVTPAYEELRRMGFKNVNVLYIADNFGTEWVEKGFPVERGS